MSNVTKVMDLRRMMGKMGLRLSNDKFIHNVISTAYDIMLNLDVGQSTSHLRPQNVA